jgi:thiosulfate dehydrogenase [quinone] large subunit
LLAVPGWLLMPLRGFLGITFVYAGLQKIANPGFLNGHSPTSIVGQMQSLQHTSPIGGMLAIAAHTPTLAGLTIALGELAVGLGTLLGLYLRIAAAGGALLALVFFLTVSWTTTPYYYGADIVFLFAWITLLGFGDQGILSLQTWIAERADRRAGRRQARASAIGPARRPDFADREIQRTTRRAAVLVAGGAAALAGLTAALGRLAGNTRRPLSLARPAPGAASNAPTPTSSGSTAVVSAPPTAASAHAAPRTTPAHLPGTAIGPTGAVPVGQARSFTDPATGDPAWIIQPTTGHFVAFDAVCTHAGCTVNYNPATNHFECPCHGGMFDAGTGQVLQGPPEAPLRAIAVTSTGGEIRVDV